MGQRGRKSAAALAVVPGIAPDSRWAEPAVVKPPRALGKPGMALWHRIAAEYELTDAGSIEQLAQACAALDRAEQCRERIDRDGEMIEAKAGPRENPLLKHELANRAFVTRTLQRLGLER